MIFECLKQLFKPTGNTFRVNQRGNDKGIHVAKTGTGAGSAIYVDNDGTSPGLEVIQDGVGYGIDVDQDAAESGVRISQSANDIALEVIKSGTGAGVGVSVANAGTGNAVTLTQTGNVTGATLAITQTGTGVPLDITPNATTLTLAKVNTPANGGAMTLKCAVGTHTVAGGNITETITGAIPAESLVVGIALRVTTNIVMATGVNYDVGVSGATTRYVTNSTKLTAGDVVDFGDYTAASTPMFYSAATDLLLTADAGTWTSGALRYHIWYWTLTGPTS